MEQRTVDLLKIQRNRRRGSSFLSQGITDDPSRWKNVMPISKVALITGSGKRGSALMSPSRWRRRVTPW